MCLLTNQTKPLIAEQDLKVYKMLRIGLRGLYFTKFIYELGQLYQTQMILSSNGSHMDDKSSWAYERYNHDDVLNYVGPGFHAALKPERFCGENYGWKDNIDLYECTIPKGSEYYLDNSGLIVSNQIIIDKKIEKPEGFNENVD